MSKAYKKLDPLLHTPLRLAIISFLVSNGESNFNGLKKVTEATSGNLSVQLKKLEEAGYVAIKKSFKNNYQHTAVRITQKGIRAFEKYVNAIKQYLE
ncbi:MAG TPA: transcriptional regulator [Bacteroidetes bacterium]|nr:transcriptional regulator [Bacteroidota bacterium]